MKFVYKGEPNRYYPTLGLSPFPGEAYDLDADPGDGRWTAEATNGKLVKAQAATSEDGDN